MRKRVVLPFFLLFLFLFFFFGGGGVSAFCFLSSSLFALLCAEHHPAPVVEQDKRQVSDTAL